MVRPSYERELVSRDLVNPDLMTNLGRRMPSFAYTTMRYPQKVCKRSGGVTYL